MGMLSGALGGAAVGCILGGIGGWVGCGMLADFQMHRGGNEWSGLGVIMGPFFFGALGAIVGGIYGARRRQPPESPR